MRFGRTVQQTFLLAALCGFVAVERHAQANIPSLTAAQWRQDLHVLATQLPKLHKNAFHSVSRRDFESAVAALDRDIPNLPAYEIMVRMMGILAMVGDGHTRCDDLFNAFSFYPVDLYWFGDDLRVVRTTKAYRAALGSKVVAIGETPIREADQNVRSLIERDESEGWMRRFSAFYLSSPEVLKSLGITSSLGDANFWFESGDRRFAMPVRSESWNSHPDWVDAAISKPLYRQRTAEVWFTHLTDQHLMYLAFNHYPDEGELNTIATRLLQEIDRDPSARLAIDFRNNWGGDYIRFRNLLLTPLKRRKWLHQRGHLFALIGRNTYSAAMMNALDLKVQMNAILVGEPTGARPNSYSEAGQFELPNSHFHVQYSRLYYKLVPGNPAGLMPDKFVPPTWADYREGRDSALAWVSDQANRE